MEHFFLFRGFLRVCRYVPRAVTLPSFQAWRVFFTGFKGRSEGWKRAGRTFTVEPVSVVMPNVLIECSRRHVTSVVLVLLVKHNTAY